MGASCHYQVTLGPAEVEREVGAMEVSLEGMEGAFPSALHPRIDPGKPANSVSALSPHPFLVPQHHNTEVLALEVRVSL
jgi:hypothetical protein